MALFYLSYAKQVTPRIAVVGSINADLFIRMPVLPGRGETVAGGQPDWFPGGKGANQAVAAARMGGHVVMHAAVGDDEPGRMAVANLEAAGIDLRYVRKSQLPTSIALVMVEESGENQIVIAQGANDDVHVDAAAVSEADAVILQNEIPVSAMLEAARACTGLLCINAAPVRTLPKELLDRVDVLIVNEPEFEAYGKPTKGVVVLTKGKDEAVVYQDGEVKATAKPPEVDAIDTVGAGDTFVGAFVVAMTSGMNLEDSLNRAVHAASLSTLKNGAQTGMPTKEQVDEFMNKKGS